MEFLLKCFTGLNSLVMVFGGAAPYIPQYMKIKKTDSYEGFSPYVCLVLLVANTLRIIFWFGHEFEIPLLLQSILMNIVMMSLVHCCVVCKSKGQLITNQRERLFTDFDYRYFWEWSDFQSYIEFFLVFSTMGFFVMFLFIDCKEFVEAVGYVALLTEAMLATPQFYKNFVSRSTAGMSNLMVGMWLVGDTYKTVYFILRDNPTQFVVCGLLQISIDLAIVAQCFFYGKKKTFMN